MRASASAVVTLFTTGLFVLLTVGGCPPANDPNAATVAGEIEAFLPTGVTLEVSELPEDEDTEQVATSPARNMYDRMLRSCSTVVHRFHRFVDECLALGATISDDLTDPNQTQVAGTFTIDGQEVPYKADFAAFDFDGDGDGTADGSGNAVTLPIALRVWTDAGDGYQRFFCALIAQKPTDDNVGQGQLFVRPFVVLPTVPADVQIYTNYDRTDAAHKWNEAYVAGTLHPRHITRIGHVRVDVRTDAAGGTEKTVRSAYQFTNNPYGFADFQSAAHWALGETALLVTGQTTVAGAQLSVEDLCLDLTEVIPLSDTACDGFDTQDMTLLELPTGDEAEFPAEFPETPTF